ncbi:MAG: HAD-IA family hydrolase [Armatimonadota bacterium]|nr:HAD-IA family hydrolase [Armatimonadota bacterium]MDR7436635.1 HAD-IA family hydrolase [Armatimonadota bacterium]MDR7472946.1 HAD-IA family hydrolase [Armatimonadota bacterium]MDR7507555.1 HAD-IA family hydrolase [Armatimonadota bacterium]MDR7509969.1 HAD-IA family hydrolase [Armatimonadota bacterium]
MPPAGDVALIFDLDNTLILSPTDFLAVRRRLIDLLEQAGVRAGAREDLMALSLPDLVRVGEQADPGLGPRMWEVIGAAEADGLARAAVAPGAREVLAALRARGYRLALLTNTSGRGLRERLAALGLLEYFDVVATRDDVPDLKPGGGGIVSVLRRLPGVRRAYMIGDAWIDAEAAVRAGVPFIGVGPKRSAVEARGLPVWAWVDDLRQILDLELDPREGGAGD